MENDLRELIKLFTKIQGEIEASNSFTMCREDAKTAQVVQSKIRGSNFRF